MAYWPGYETSSKLASEALETNRGIYDLVLEKELLTKKELDRLLAPENMINPNYPGSKKGK